MKTYETVIILNERKIQDEGKDFVEEFSSKISRAGGKILRKTPLGRKQFARQIKKAKTGLYWDVVFDWDEQKIRNLSEDYRLDEKVLRLQTFIYDRPEDPTKEVKEKKAATTEEAVKEHVAETIVVEEEESVETAVPEEVVLETAAPAEEVIKDEAVEEEKAVEAEANEETQS